MKPGNTIFTDEPPYKWKTVRVFISSTFRDFHAERDYLVKHVFPELRQWCEKYKLHLIDIDLRWGVTEQEAESGKVIELCLEQIDGSRPFFICMLGDRYGWIPNEIERNKVDEETLLSFPDLKVKWKNLSVTHLEILHAALSPFDGADPVPHSFFYFRDKESLPDENELKLYSTDQRKEYLKTFLEEEPKNEEKLINLKGAIEKYYKNEIDGRVFPYTPNFDPSLSNPEDDKLKGRFTSESLNPFGDKVKEHLLHALEIQFADRIKYLSEKREEDSLENERDFHEAFIENRTTLFIGRTELLQRLHDYVNSDSNKILAVYGESGSGKSALLAKFYREYKFDIKGSQINQDVLFIPHFIGASPSSSTKHSMLRRFCKELKNKFNYEDEIPVDPNKLVVTFKNLLEKANSKLIILIDGLNQLDETDRAQELDWLPYKLPENVKIIASALEGKAKDSLKGLTNEQLEVGELDKDERREIIREMPSVFAKTLEKKHIDILLKKKATSNPLYLKVALEELRIFGSFEKLEEKVRVLPDTVTGMFIDVIERLEQEVEKELVERLFCLLECSRYGLTDNELEELLNDDKKEHIIILRQVRDYFISKDGLIDFFHRGLSKAVKQKYDLENESIKWHKKLAEYFAKKPHFLDDEKQKKPNVHKCIEQPWQETKGAMWDEVTETLCDLKFIQAKCSAGMSYDLVNDFNAAMESIPDNAEDIRKEKERQICLEKYVEDLVQYSKGEIKKLKVPRSISPWSEEKTNAEIANIKANPSRADSLKDFYNFLGHEVDNLQKHAKEIPHLAAQQAWNYADSGPVGKAAGEMSDEVLHRLLLRSVPTRPPWHPLAQVLKTIRGVNTVAITPDGKKAFSGSTNKTCTLWDLQSGEPLKILKGHSNMINAVAITPDGKFALSGSGDKTCIFWDLQSGSPSKILKGHTFEVLAVAITPDGKKGISGSSEICILWDLENGGPPKYLKGHSRSVRSVVIAVDGKKAISGSGDKCILWDLDNGKQLKTLKIQVESVSTLAITADGKRVILGSEDKCILWDLESERTAKILEGHTYDVLALAITPDGKKAVSGSSDKTCILWDLECCKPLKILKGHSQGVLSVAITADGKMAISGSRDDTCILWDLERGFLPNILGGHSKIITSIAVTPDGKRGLSGSWDKTCILWDLRTNEALKTLNVHNSGITALAITPDGKKAVSGSRDKTCILWDLQSGKLLKSLTGHSHYVKSLFITPDGKRGLSGSYDKTCIFWDLENENPPVTLKGHSRYVMAVATTPDGKRGISVSEDKTCILWDLQCGELLKSMTGHVDRVMNVAITSDGKTALSGSGDNTCILWDLESGKPRKTLNGHTKMVNVIAISPDGKMALSGSDDRTCILWELESGLPCKTLNGHTSSVRALVITPDGKMAISGSRDMTCILWDLQTGEKMAQYFGTSGLNAITFFLGGIIGGGNSGEIFILNAHRELLCPGIGIITARKIWDFELKQYQPLSADCPFCGMRFSPPKFVMDTIKEITKRAGFSPEQSPCLDLSKEVWEEPGLLSACPQCGENLKFNPFIVDNKDIP